jgi:hypothetical protein
MPVNTINLVLLGSLAIVVAACSYDGSERKIHTFTRPDGIPVTCVEPPQEVVKLAKISTEVDASAKEIGFIAKGVVRGEFTPERIREKLPEKVQVLEAVHYRLCLDYANDLLTKAAYQVYLSAYLDATGGLPRKEQSMNMSDRAWIVVKDVRIDGSVEENALPKATVTYENTGRTPALKTRLRHRLAILRSAKLPDGPMPAIRVNDNDVESVFTLGPSQLTYSENGLTTPLSKDQVLHLKNKEWSIITFGIISYDDAAGQHHATEFCFVWRDITTRALSSCDRWNDSTWHFSSTYPRS